ncbi:MAG: DMT family transporter [Potamolinea sp.]
MNVLLMNATWYESSLPQSNANQYPEENPTVSTMSYFSKQSAPNLAPHTTVLQIPQIARLPKGFVLVLLSSLLLAFQNVVIAMIFNKSQIFGMLKLGGFVAANVGNSLLIVWIRMLIVVPSLAILATFIYPPMWREIKQFTNSKKISLFINVLACGFFLFVSQVLIYLALGTIKPGIAITIFFLYPIFTILLTWIIFNTKASLFHSLLILFVLGGFVRLTLPIQGLALLSGVGIMAAGGSAIAFAFYLLLAQSCAKKLNPVPLSWINFATMLVFSSFSLLAPLPKAWHFKVAPSMWSPLIISSLVLGILTVVSYLFNNIGIRLIDARRASIVGATLPVLTAILAWIIINSKMPVEQVFGMLLVTLGIAAFSLNQWRRARKKAPVKSS